MSYITDNFFVTTSRGRRDTSGVVLDSKRVFIFRRIKKGEDQENKNVTLNLQINETLRSKETKLIRFLRKFITQRRCFTVRMQEKQPNEVVIQAERSVHCQ